MKTKIKTPPSVKPRALLLAKAPVLHDVTNQSPSQLAASRRRIFATQPASGAANHTRHHVAPSSQR